MVATSPLSSAPVGSQNAAQASGVYSGLTQETSASGDLNSSVFSIVDSRVDIASAADLNSANSVLNSNTIYSGIAGDTATASVVSANSRADSVAGSDSNTSAVVASGSTIDSSASTDLSNSSSVFASSSNEIAASTDSESSAFSASATRADNINSGDVSVAVAVFSASNTETASSADLGSTGSSAAESRTESATSSDTNFSAINTADSKLEVTTSSDNNLSSINTADSKYETASSFDSSFSATSTADNKFETASVFDSGSSVIFAVSSLAQNAAAFDSEASNHAQTSSTTTDAVAADSSLVGLSVFMLQADTATAGSDASAEFIAGAVIYNDSQSETSSAGESYSSPATFTASNAEAAAATDTRLTNQTQIGSLSNSTISATTQIATQISQSALNESASVDSVVSGTPLYSVSFTDAAVADGLQSNTYISVGDGLLYEVNEVSSVDDNPFANINAQSLKTDQSQSTDSYLAANFIAVNLFESSAANDNCSANAGNFASLADSVAATDGGFVQAGGISSLAEQAAAGNDADNNYVINVTQTDASNSGDTLSLAFISANSGSESVKAGDTLAAAPFQISVSLNEQTQSADFTSDGTPLGIGYTDNVVSVDFSYASVIPEANGRSLSSAVYRVLIAAVAPVPLIKANQNGPRPAKPFATYSIRTTTPQTEVHHEVDVDGRIRIDQFRRSVVEVQFFGSGADRNAQTASLRLRAPSVVELTERLGIGISSIVAVNISAELLNSSQFENRAILEFVVNSVLTEVDDVGRIESVDLDCFGHNHLIGSSNAA